MTNRILFLEELRKRLDEVLIQEGFQVTLVENEMPECIYYQRLLKDMRGKDILTFNGTESGGVIYAIAKAGKRKDLLTTIRLLDPNFDDLDINEQDNWSYSSEAELKTKIDEIIALVETYLINWFNSDTTIPLD